jgi:hypothetical protein
MASSSSATRIHFGTGPSSPATCTT